MPKFPTKKRRPWEAETRGKQTGRLKRNYKFYNSHQWRKFRADYIQRHPLCVICKKSGIIVEGKVVDHIQRINDGGAKWDENNLQTLCRKCHNKKSGREAHGYREHIKKNESKVCQPKKEGGDAKE